MSQISNKFLAQAGTLTIKGNLSGGTANVSDNSLASLNLVLPVFTSTLNGLAPLSGGGTANFLRADGTWDAPPGTVLTIGTPVTAASANAATIVGTVLALQVAGIGFSGIVDIGVQSFQGAKTFAGGIDNGGNILTSVASPVASTDAANKAYVDAAIQGLSWKSYARVLSNVFIDLTVAANPSPVDGVTLADGDSIVLQNQTAPAENGIYDAVTAIDPTTWIRRLDADTGPELIAAAIFIDEGTSFADTAWVQTTPGPIVLGTTAIAFVQFSSATSVSFNNGLLQTGSVVNVVPGDGSLTATPGSLIVKKDPAGALAVSGSGLAVAVLAAGGIQISTNQLALKLADASLVLSGSGVGVLKDPAGALSVSVAGLAVAVDGVTVKIKTDALEALQPRQYIYTLLAGDITAQFIDLPQVAFGSSALLNSVQLCIVGSAPQLLGIDYTISLTGGVAGVTRLTFAGGLATGGISALVAGDIMMVNFSFLA